MDFYAEFRKLVDSRPHNAIHSRSVENATYGDYLFRSKNIYLSFFLSEAEDCYYCDYLSKCRDCIDCSYVTGSELCYECVDCSGIYEGSFLQDCHNSSQCEFCFDCINCKDCFGCFGLRQQRFCIFNKVYPEDVYRKKVAEFKKNSPQKILQILSPEFAKHPRLFARLLKGGENSLGDYIYYSKNCFQCFNVRNVENAAYISEMMDQEGSSHECFDCNFGSNLESCYDCHDALGCSNCNFLVSSSFCSDCEYLQYCYNCQNCFGCTYLMNKQYCILNRQFTREEYVLALAKIKGALKKAGTYGKSLAEVLKGSTI